MIKYIALFAFILSTFRAAIYKVLYDCKTANFDFSDQRLKDELPDITTESRKCHVPILSEGLKIAAEKFGVYKLTLPYECARVHLKNVALQVPFFLLCNDIFELSGYNSFCVPMGPLPGMNSLLSLQVDAPTLYSLFCISQTGRKMEILDLDNTVIENRAQIGGIQGWCFQFLF